MSGVAWFQPHQLSGPPRSQHRLNLGQVYFPFPFECGRGRRSLQRKCCRHTQTPRVWGSQATEKPAKFRKSPLCAHPAIGCLHSCWSLRMAREDARETEKKSILLHLIVQERDKPMRLSTIFPIKDMGLTVLTF